MTLNPAIYGHCIQFYRKEHSHLFFPKILQVHKQTVSQATKHESTEKTLTVLQINTQCYLLLFHKQTPLFIRVIKIT